ncbi:TonB-dependent receptor [Sphingobium sp. YR768]|uniref:TonB-dependent receptor n=1 Tax=Sphingobium sp. YR768 TaxID=1884365 RepID=UPI0008C4C050|nr:TonB-dependent receptor [Sphingobium sp. YR768]SER33831.1 Outer membrane receptor proteins, mostly Fe transport [Sphingobium sp. YR768]
MKTITHVKSVSLAALAAATLFSAPAMAQAPADESETIIVTAGKRDEDIRQVAMPISAVTGEQLKKMNANSLSDYITRLPGVVFNDYQPGISEVVIRGVAATTYHEQGQTTVGYYLNEVPVVEPGFPIGIPDVDTFDLQRVEVLRGPQGTLFGSSTLGGLVNYVANVADASKIDAAASGIVGTTKNASGELNYAAKAMINIPLVEDQLAVRLVALQRSDAGYLDNPGIGVNGSNDYRTRGLRGSIVAHLGETTKVTYLSSYQDSKLDDQTYLDLKNPYIRDVPRAESQKTDFWMNSLRFDQEIGDVANFTALGSITKKTNTTVFSYPYAYVTGVTTGDEAAYSLGEADALIKTVEARLASAGEGPFKWLVGVSYMQAKKNSYDQIFQSGAEAYINAHPDLFGGYSGAQLTPGDRLYGYQTKSTNEDFGVFGELSFKPVEQFEITVGGRYYNTTAKADVLNQAGALGGYEGGYTPTDSSGSVNQKEDGFLPKATVAWRPSKDVMVYATYSQGYRVGGINPNAGLLESIPESYESDKVKNYEAGVKTQTPDGRFAIDLTGFRIYWNNIQARLFGPAPSYYSYVVNAGGARINGVEFSGTVNVNRMVRFSSNVTWQDAKITEFLPYPFDAAGLGGYPKGTVLPGSSKWSVANNLTLTLNDVSGAPTFDIAHRYLSSAPTSFDDVSRRGDFNMFDLRASIGVGEKIRLMAFANNVFDKFGILNAPFANDASPLPQGSIIRPRTLGLRFDWSL